MTNRMQITESQVSVSIRGYADPAAIGADEVSPVLSAVRELAEKAARAALAAEEIAAAAESDPHLSPAGIAAKRADLIIKHLQGVDLDRSAATVREKVVARKQQIMARTLPKHSDTPHEIAMEGEILRFVRDMEKSKRGIWLIEHSADPQLAGAVLNAPAYLSGLSDEERETFRVAVVSKQHPQAAAELEYLQRAEEAIGRVVGNAESMIARRGGVLRNTNGGWEPA